MYVTPGINRNALDRDMPVRDEKGDATMEMAFSGIKRIPRGIKREGWGVTRMERCVIDFALLSARDLYLYFRPCCDP